jgi:hypothetical protein
MERASPRTPSSVTLHARADAQTEALTSDASRLEGSEKFPSRERKKNFSDFLWLTINTATATPGEPMNAATYTAFYADIAPLRSFRRSVAITTTSKSYALNADDETPTVSSRLIQH